MTPEEIAALLASLADMTADQVKGEHAKLLASIEEIKPAEGSERLTLAQLQSKKALTETANTVAETYTAILDAEGIQSPGDLPEEPAKTVEPSAEELAEAAAAEAAAAEAAAAETAAAEAAAAEAAAAEAGTEGGDAGDTGNGGAATGQVQVGNNEPTMALAPIMAAAFDGAPFEKGSNLGMTELALAFQHAADIPGGHTTVVASLNAHDHSAPKLGLDPVANHAILFPESTDRLDITAAVCGPTQPIMNIPECFRGGEPMKGTLTTVPTSYGQIQVYAPQGMGELAGVNIPAATCEDCEANPSAAVQCLKADCIVPLDPVAPVAGLACLCVDEALAFSNPMVLQHHMRRLTAHWEMQQELRRMEKIREQSFVRQFTAPYGSAAGLIQSIAQTKSLIMANPRFTGTFEDYIAFIPAGEIMFATLMADIGNRFARGGQGSADAVLSSLAEMGVSQIVYGLDWDANHSVDGTMPTELTGALGNPGAAPLEPFEGDASIYLYKRGDFLTASPFQVQIGLDTREKSELPNGCLKMYRREYWIDPIKFGCSPAVVLDYSGLCASGSGPDAMSPVCAGSEAGGGGPALP